MHDEQHIITSAIAGDATAFGEIYTLYVKRIYAFIYTKTWHREMAEDLTSQTFLKACEAIRRFDPARGTLQAWLYQIARNTVTDHYRAARPTADISDAWDLTDGTDIPRDLEMKLQLERVQQGLKGLTPDQREIVLLRVWQDLSHAEIAAIMGKTPDAVKVAYSRAVGQLRPELLLLLVLLTEFVRVK